MTKPVLTADLTLIGEGSFKRVYAHPHLANQVVKVMKRKKAGADGGISNQKGLRRHRHHGIYRQFRREITQFLQLCKNNYATSQYDFPVEIPYGLMPTDQGLALVAEKITSHNGQGQTLSSLCRSDQFTAKHKAALDRFFDDCCTQHVVFGEVNVDGIMYTETRHDRPEFVLVDGIGDKLFIPFRAMSQRINTKNVRKVQQQIQTKLGI